MKLGMMLAAGSFVLTASSAYADTFQLAQSLGDVLASEQFCGLKYDQAAIATFIKDRVPANDLEFTGNLKGATSLATYSLKNMSQSEKTAHCTQIRRVAASYKFIAE